MDPINTDPGSELSHGLARGWLESCLSRHSQSSGSRQLWMPTRLLKVSEVSGVRRLQLCQSEPGTVKPYAALTYCWGGPQRVRALRNNIHQHLVEIPIQDLPKTLRDAVDVTAGLGMAFLWVDSLCIIQDDDDNKNREIANMSRVYTNAAVVIGAARAKTAEEGFLGPRMPPRSGGQEWAFQMRYRCPDGQEGCVVLDPICLAPKEPIHERAWTVQEHILARRLLTYGTFQTRWVCQCSDAETSSVDGLWREVDKNEGDIGYLQDLLRNLEAGTGGISEAADLWDQIVSLHSHRQLGVPQDRLRSLAGVADYFAEVVGLSRDDYVCGMWKTWLPQALLWQTSRFRASAPKDPLYIAPSWSWAAGNRAVGRGRCVLDDIHESFQCLECEVVLEDAQAPYGAVLSGHLKVRGLLLPAERGPFSPFINLSPAKGVGLINAYADPEGFINSTWAPRFLLCITCKNEDAHRIIQGLVLQEIEDGSRISSFLRVGSFYSQAGGEKENLLQLFRESGSKVITIL